VIQTFVVSLVETPLIDSEVGLIAEQIVDMFLRQLAGLHVVWERMVCYRIGVGLMVEQTVG
jgi:hypothetical protein